MPILLKHCIRKWNYEDRNTVPVLKDLTYHLVGRWAYQQMYFNGRITIMGVFITFREGVPELLKEFRDGFKNIVMLKCRLE